MTQNMKTVFCHKILERIKESFEFLGNFGYFHLCRTVQIWILSNVFFAGQSYSYPSFLPNQIEQLQLHYGAKMPLRKHDITKALSYWNNNEGGKSIRIIFQKLSPNLIPRLIQILLVYIESKNQQIQPSVNWSIFDENTTMEEVEFIKSSIKWPVPIDEASYFAKASNLYYYSLKLVYNSKNESSYAGYDDTADFAFGKELIEIEKISEKKDLDSLWQIIISSALTLQRSLLNSNKDSSDS